MFEKVGLTVSIIALIVAVFQLSWDVYIFSTVKKESEEEESDDESSEE